MRGFTVIKNVYVKRIMKNTVFQLITLINKVIPKNDSNILLYTGNKGISFNLKPLYEYLLTNGYNKKYRIICSVESKEYFGKKHENVKYVNHVGGVFSYLKSKHVFYTAGQLPIKPSDKQIVIHMNHGTTDYKTTGALTKINNGDEFFFTYFVAPSSIYVPILQKEYCCTEKNIIISNEPMIERIICPKKKYEFKLYSKTLLWAPTFRKSDYLGYDDSTMEELVPLFSEADFLILNEELSKRNILLIVKLHPSQKIPINTVTKMTHLKIYSHEEFINEDMNLYDMMGQVDGLVGDYSSVSLQFLLTEKPLAYVVPDIEEYKEKRGFVFENVYEYMPGHIIKTQSQFFEFLDDFINGVDVYYSERIRIKNIIHTYQDTQACKRILEFSNIQFTKV